MKNLNINYLITKLKGLGLLLLSVLMVLITFVLLKSDALAGYSEEKKRYIDPTVKTNVNKVDPFFEEQIENLNNLKEALDGKNAENMEKFENSAGLEEIPGYEHSSGEVDRLSSISASELESRGREEMAKEPMMSKIFIDHNDPLVQQDKRDIDEIILKEARGLLNNILEELKKHGIDCEAVAGNEIVEPEFQVETATIETQNRVYDKVLCEQLKNQYNCRDVLTVKCSDPSTVGGAVKNVTGNMVHTISGDGTLIIGVNQERYFYNNWGSQQDYEFSFDVENAAAVASFNLMNVDWADYVLIKLNDNIIFQEPGVRGKIEMSTKPEHYRLSSKGERFYGVDIGVGDYVCVNTRTYHSRAPHSEVKHLLKNGKNTLKIRLAYGNGGKIHVVLKYKEKICNAWQESWSEKCLLK